MEAVITSYYIFLTKIKTPLLGGHHVLLEFKPAGFIIILSFFFKKSSKKKDKKKEKKDPPN
jgi:hypothetical protein